MSVAATIVRNSAFLFAGNLLTRAFSFILIVMIGRSLGDSGLGIYAFSLAVVDILGLTTEWGIYVLIVRAVARNHAKMQRYLNNYFTLKLFLTAGFLVCYNAIVLSLPFEPTKKTVMMLASLCYGVYFMNNPFFSMYQALQRMEFEAALRTADSALCVGLSVVFLGLGFGLPGVFLAVLISRLIVFSANYIIASTAFARPRLAYDLPLWKEFILRSWPFFLTTLLGTIYFQINNVILSFMKGDEVVGWFSAAYRMVSALAFIPLTVTYTVYPAMAKLYMENKETLKQLINILFKGLFIVIWPITLGTFLCAERLISLVFGTGFVNSVLPLKILIFAQLLQFFNLIMVQVTNAIEEEKAMSYILMACTVLSVLLNIAAIPIWSYIGASLVTVAVELVNFILSVILVARSLYRIPLLRLTYRPLLCGLVMAACTYWLLSLPLFSQTFMIAAIIGISGIVYAGLIALSRDIRRADVERLVSASRKGD